MSVVKANTYQDASGGSNAVFSGVASPPNSMGFRNRIINGDMRIDQRNAGASVTPTSAATAYAVDRFALNTSQASGKMTAQRSTGLVGFSNSLLITSTSAYSVTSGDYFLVDQNIEGFNVADLGWGTANAVAVTLSFRVKSSLTGTFGGVISNSANNRSYPFSYTISAANTETAIAVTIPGDTSGTWLTDNGIGMKVRFSMGVGTTYQGTANAWAGATYLAPTGATSVVGTNGATFYITGVQLEAGSVVSPFERRDYGRELAMCQRYYSRQGIFGRGNIAAHITVPINVNMRTTPSVTTISTYTADGAAYTVYTDAVATNNFDVKVTWTGGGTTSAYSAEFGAGAELL